MSSEKLFLTQEEQIFLMEMYEINDPVLAAEKFALEMIDQKVDPRELQKYLRKIMGRMK